MGALASSLEQPFGEYFGQEAYPTLAEKAAALLFFICQNHPFHDGNKRTAYQAMEVFLAMQGFELTLTEDEAVQLVLDLADGGIGIAEITERIEPRIGLLYGGGDDD